MIISLLTKGDCIEVIKANRLAHLACARAGQPYVVPIYYAYAEPYAYSFTMPGQKLDWMRGNPRVCLQVDDRTEGGWRSVLVTCKFEALPDEVGHKRERDRAWQLLSQHANWWEPGAVRPDPAAFSDHSPHVSIACSLKRCLAEAPAGRSEARIGSRTLSAAVTDVQPGVGCP